MPIYELHSNEGVQLTPDLFRYDQPSMKLAAQTVMTINRTVGNEDYRNHVASWFYQELHSTLSLEFGNPKNRLILGSTM